MDQAEHRNVLPISLNRRRFIAASAGVMAGVAVAGPTDAANAAGRRPYRFGLLGDTQIDAAEPARTEWVGWVYQQIAEAGPDVVCHVGDLVEHGSVDEYDLYLGTIPEGLRSRVHHVPGNHEWRWDPTAGERYRALFGPTRFSFNAGGIHFVGLDPSHQLQEPGGFGVPGVAWLERDLSRVRPGMPIILMSHFPFGGENRYVSDQERLVRLLSGHNVRAILAGHTHREELTRFNGVIQLVVDDARSAPRYYWAERDNDGDRPILRITGIERSGDGSPVSREVTEIPLAGPRPAANERPRRISLNAGAGALAVSVRLRSAAEPETVEAQLHPQHTYGVKDPGTWHPLAADGPDGYSGELDVGGLPGGRHRMTVRVTGTDGAWHEETREFTRPLRRLWRHRLNSAVQAGLAQHEGLLVAATASGTVLAARPTDGGLNPQWRSRLGPVHGGPAFSADGRTVYVPSNDHKLHALDSATGLRRFAYDAGAPVVGSPLVTEIGDRSAVVVSAGESRHAIDATTGERLWVAKGQGMFAGRFAGEGEQVYAGGGDGNAYAYEAATGEVRWKFSTTDRASVYQRLIYGPWYNRLELLPGGLVLVATVLNAFALDPATGQPVWTRPGSYIYAPVSLLDGGDLLLIDDWRRTITRVDAATGTERWTGDLGVRVLNTGAVVRDGTAWIPGTTGLLVAVDLSNGQVVTRTQVTTTAYCYSSPALIDQMIVVGDQDGVLQALPLTS